LLQAFSFPNAWLFDGLAHSAARWNVIGQGLLMAELRQKTPDDDFGYRTDDWDGYPASRTPLLQRISQSRVRYPVVLGGDIHSFWSQTVAIELVGTSVKRAALFPKYLPDNPHAQYLKADFEATPAPTSVRPRCHTFPRCL
jgi:alkaline phosphatase D